MSARGTNPDPGAGPAAGPVPLSAAQRSASAAIDPVAVASDLLALCAIPSVTGHETAARDHLARSLAAIDLDVHSWDADPGVLAADPAFPGMEVPRTALPLVAGTLRGARPGRRLLLVAHTDVVPPGDTATWTTPPFSPTVRDGHVFGRGACDMKLSLIHI